MRKISKAQLFFKCCHLIDKNMKGYMFKGKYIDCISQHCWQMLEKYLKSRNKQDEQYFISLLCDIKKRNKDKWNYFIANPKPEFHNFKKEYQLILSEVEPPKPYVGYYFNNEIIYEKWMKK